MQLDRLGVELSEQDIVVTVKYNGLALCKVTRFTNKMVKLCPLDNSGHWRVSSEFAAYSKDILKVDQQQAVLFLLKEVQHESNYF